MKEYSGLQGLAVKIAIECKDLGGLFKIPNHWNPQQKQLSEDLPEQLKAVYHNLEKVVETGDLSLSLEIQIQGEQN